MTPAPDGAYALRYAYRTESRKGEHFYGHIPDCHEDWPIHYYTWVVIENGIPHVFDAGFTHQEAANRGSRLYLESPIDLLARLGFGPERVPNLVLSHLHYDHTGFVDAYPKARIWLQRSEWDFWTGPLATRGSYGHLHRPGDITTIRQLHTQGRLQLLDGPATLTENISIHLVGGHTAGTQVVRAQTPEGVVVLASDASHFYANVEGDRPYGIVHELPRMYAAFDTLYALAGPGGVIVPGHDPLVVERHEPLAGTADRIIRLRPATPTDPSRRG